MNANYCGRLLIGQGSETWDAECLLPDGHEDVCRPVRPCANPECPRVLDAGRVVKHGATTCDDKCRARAWKLRTGYGRHDNPNLQGEGKERQEGRANVSQRRKRSPASGGVTLSYRRAVAAVAYAFTDEAQETQSWVDDDEGRKALAESILRSALSDKQRARLDAKEERVA